MIWWFMILGLEPALVLCVGIASVLQVRRHMKPRDQPCQDEP